ncbi:MAG TPA: hypothetical protein VGV88_08405 [Candidatus Dormibacteraeota bacterium]|nr:hypothetical protein [Candidatus Dormibacteraeota bacterium]
MTENTRQVLEMLAEGKITTEEADRLISALREQPSAPGAAPAKKPRYLRVIVDSNDSGEGPVKINIRVPLMLLRAGVRLASVIPPQAQERVNKALREQGVDFDITTIKPENLEELIDELKDLTVDIEQQRDDVKVKVFTE